jgi:hypothetical protein
MTRQPVDTAPNPAGILGTLCVSPDGQRYYLVDGGDLDGPGPGKVQAYDESLHLLAQFDLGAQLGYTPALSFCAVSRDGRFLLVSAGHSGGGELYPYQPGRLLVVDPTTGNLVRTVEIGSWTREVFAF